MTNKEIERARQKLIDILKTTPVHRQNQPLRGLARDVGTQQPNASGVEFREKIVNNINHALQTASMINAHRTAAEIEQQKGGGGKKFYKAWQFWTIVAILAAAIITPSVGYLLTKGASNSFVRPYVIFDASTIHNDGGAMEYLEDIKVEVTGQTYANASPEDKHDSQLEITIAPKQYLAHAPLIESLGGLRSMIIYDGKRGTKNQWVYTVLVRPPYGGDIKTQKFRLEILR